MTIAGWAEIALTLALVLAAAIPLSRLIDAVYAGRRNFLSPALRPVEVGFYRLAGVDETREQTWLVYALAMLAFSIAGFVSAVRAATPAEPSAAQSAGFRRRRARPRLQHLDQLHHQHQLAELRRRDDDEPSDADARPHRA